MLLISSTGLEFTRLHRFDSLLPGHRAGGVVGYLVGSTANSWLGFNGSGLIFIVFMVIGLSWVFRFSWIQLAEKMGSAIDGLIEKQREKREIAQDLALGEAAARAREKDMVWERDENADIPAHPVRILVEPEPAANGATVSTCPLGRRVKPMRSRFGTLAGPACFARSLELPAQTLPILRCNKLQILVLCKTRLRYLFFSFPL